MTGSITWNNKKQGVDEYLVYDLLKKNQMEAVIVDYWKRIPKESFQNWYKSQSRYRTKEDREKDALLEDATITMPEMAQLLGTTRSAVYTILDNPKYSHFFEFIVIAEKKRITKESFQKFLEGQDRYKLDPSNDYEELAQEGQSIFSYDPKSKATEAYRRVTEEVLEDAI